MIEAKLLSVWDGLVQSAALIALVVLALYVMVRGLSLEGLPRHLGFILGAMILLIILPAIILSRWNAMPFWQHLGIGTAVVAIVFLVAKKRIAITNIRSK